MHFQTVAVYIDVFDFHYVMNRLIVLRPLCENAQGVNKNVMFLIELYA